MLAVFVNCVLSGRSCRPQELIESSAQKPLVKKHVPLPPSWRDKKEWSQAPLSAHDYLKESNDHDTGFKSTEAFPYDVPWSLLKHHPLWRLGPCRANNSIEAGIGLNLAWKQLGISRDQRDSLEPELTAAYAQIRNIEASEAQLSTKEDGSSQVVLNPSGPAYDNVRNNLAQRIREILPSTKADPLLELLERDFYLGTHSQPRTLEVVIEEDHQWLKLTSPALPWMNNTNTSATEGWYDFKHKWDAREGNDWMDLHGRYRDLTGLLDLPDYKQQRPDTR